MTDSTHPSAALAEAVLQLVTTSDQKALFELALQTARQQLRIEQVSLIIFKPNRLETAAVLGNTVYDNLPGFNALWDGIEGWVVREQTPLLAIDPLKDVRISTPMQLALQQNTTTPFVAAAPCGEHGALVAVHSSLDRGSLAVLQQIGRAVSVAQSRSEAPASSRPAVVSLDNIYWQNVGLVGQGAQQVQLMRVLTAAENNTGASIALQGLPGSGKTALVEWLSQQALGHQFQVIPCYVKAHSAPYEVWRLVLKQLFPTLAPTLENCKAFLKEMNTRWEVRGGLLLNLLQAGHITDPTLAAYTVPQRHAATTNLIVDLLAQASQRQALLIVIEDADDLSEGSNDVLQNLCHRLKYQPNRLLICVTSDTEMEWAYQKIQLAPLELDHIAQLRQAFISDPVAPNLDEWLLAQTKGNPLYIRLLLGNLVETQRLQNPPASASDMPTLVRGMIERIAPHLQITLCVAAVIGSPFSLKELAAIHPEKMTDDKLQAALKELVMFIKPLADGQYAFRHPLYSQQVPYPEKLSQELHQAAAEYMERYASSQAARIAYHYQHSRSPHQARTHLSRAANVAHARRAYMDALHYINLNFALPGKMDDMEAFTILSEQADLFGKMDDAEQQARVLNQLSTIARQLDDPWLHAESGWRWLNHYYQTKQTTEGIATWKVFLSQAEKAAHTVARAEIIIAAALLYQQAGQFEETQQHLDSVVVLASQAKNFALGARILFTLGSLFEQTAHYDLAQACLEQALEIYKEAGNQVGAANCYTALGKMYTELGYFNVGYNQLQGARQIWQALGNLRESVEAALDMIQMRVFQQRYAEALAIANEVRVSVEQLAENQLNAQWWLLYGQTNRGFGNLEQALASYRNALKLSTSDQQPLIFAALNEAGDPTYLPKLQALDLSKTAYPALVYTTLAAADPQQQTAIIATAQQHILAKADQIEDEQIRQQYLSRPDRRSLVEYKHIAS